MKRQELLEVLVSAVSDDLWHYMASACFLLNIQIVLDGPGRGVVLRKGSAEIKR